MRSAMGELLVLIRQWWQADRLRVSPRDGRLLRIPAAAMLRVGEQLAEVLWRTVGEDESGPYVVYHCRSDGRPCQLLVKLLPTNRCAVRWIAGDTAREVLEEEIEVFPPVSTARGEGRLNSIF